MYDRAYSTTCANGLNVCADIATCCYVCNQIELEPQQCLRAETGAMLYMTDGVEMETTTAGGFQQGVKRCAVRP